MPARPLMIQGTGSFVGKSIIVAGLCRVLKQDGYRVAPFKSQNMALNSFVTMEGGEMGRAQVVQAEAAGLQPHVDMNPILLKPNTDIGAQVIIQGKVFRNMNADEYHGFKKEARRRVLESYARLAERYQVIVIEGAGSPAEINLRDGDIANMGVAEAIDAPVLLVGDIDKGGVFASLVGTLELLSNAERERIKGFIINKFRGDFNLLAPGLKFLEKKTGIPVLGVIPYLMDLYLPEEDGVVLEKICFQGRRQVSIAVLYLPHISNFTDFDPLEKEPEVNLRYVQSGQKIGEADAVILPGSKNTIEDFLFLKREGYVDEILALRRSGKMVIGICGGFQMLGRTIRDPFGVETSLGGVEGLGLLNVETMLKREKMTFQVKAVPLTGEQEILQGYEIHMGDTERESCVPPIFKIIDRLGQKVEVEDGAISADGKVWGTYIHGLFDNDGFRRRFIDFIRRNKGIFSWSRSEDFNYRAFKEKEYDRLAAALRNALDIERIYRIIGVP
ncbi:MAG: cobyric acid synthase [Deltaproteobacteria bacterium]|nr:cobyric acid synthase [Deltaproteobacteria bacterium]